MIMALYRTPALSCRAEPGLTSLGGLSHTLAMSVLRKLDVEEIWRATTLECPHCHALIDPRMDGEHLQCPWCDGRFIPGDEKPISC